MKTITDANFGQHIKNIKRWIASYLKSMLLPITGGSIDKKLIFGNKDFFIADTDSMTLGTGSFSQELNNEPYQDGAVIVLDKNNKSFSCVAATQEDCAELKGDADTGYLTYNDEDLVVQDNIKVLQPTSVFTKGSYFNAYQCGPLVFLSIDLQINQSYKEEVGIISNLPKPVSPVCFSCIYYGTYSSLSPAIFRAALTQNGVVILDNNVPSNENWLHGHVVYMTYE